MSSTLAGGERLRRWLRDNAELLKGTVAAGVLGGATYQQHTNADGTTNPGGQKVVDVATGQEFGGHPFMRPTIEAKKAKWAKGMGQLVATGTPVPAALALAGEQMASDIRRTIKAIGGAGGNSEATVARKGFDKPLSDTGTLLLAVGHEVIE